jgi:hypothetical protein
MATIVLLGIGAALFGGGFITLFIVLGTQNALAKSRQLEALGRVGSGKAGCGPQIALLCGAMAMGGGACACFAGIAVGDAGRARACKEECIRRGHPTGTIQGSKEKDGGRHKFVACMCSGGSGAPVELRADDLR